MVERPHPQSRNERQYGLQSFIVASPQAGSRSYIVPPPYPYMPKAYNKFRECCPPSLSSSAEVLHRSLCLGRSGCVVRTDWKIQRLDSNHSGSRSWRKKLNKEDTTSLKTLPIEESVAMALPCEKNWLTRFPNIKTMSVQHFYSGLHRFGEKAGEADRNEKAGARIANNKKGITIIRVRMLRTGYRIFLATNTMYAIYARKRSTQCR